MERCSCFDLLSHLLRFLSLPHSEGDVVSLRLLQLAFSERKCLASGKILYEVGSARSLFCKAVPESRPRRHIISLYCLFFIAQGLEYCEERFSQDLSGSAPALRTQTTNTRLLSCQTIEKFRPHPDRDDSMSEGTEGSTWESNLFEFSHCPVIS